MLLTQLVVAQWNKILLNSQALSPLLLGVLVWVILKDSWEFPKHQQMQTSTVRGIRLYEHVGLSRLGPWKHTETADLSS